jgi:hypothetical protein
MGINTETLAAAIFSTSFHISMALTSTLINFHNFIKNDLPVLGQNPVCSRMEVRFTIQGQSTDYMHMCKAIYKTLN